MNEFLTADLHYGSHNIIKYCGRPFRDAQHMNKRLTANINERCKPGDILYHIGDYCTYGKERGVESMRLHAYEYEALLDCKLIHVMGNHDRQNGVKGSLYGAFMRIGKYHVWVQHQPPWDDLNGGFKIPDQVSAYICGHVHEKWKLERWKGKPVINVGCDQWDYRPVRKDELIEVIRKQLEK